MVSQQVGRAHLVAIAQDGDQGKITQVYTVAPDLLSDAVYDANALFVGPDNAVLYGSASGYLFAWDKTSGKVLCGLDHGEGVYSSKIDATDELTQRRLRGASHWGGCQIYLIHLRQH